MHVEKNLAKEASDKVKHGLSFSLADRILSDPLAIEIYDRFENGEHRWHCFANIGGKCLLLVYAYPDPENEDFVGGYRSS